MKFLNSLLGLGFSLILVACSPAAADPAPTYPPTETTAPTATAQPTVAPPESITSQKAALESRGLELVKDDGGWALVSQESKVVLRTDGESIFIETQAGQLLEYPAGSFDVVETTGVIPLEDGRVLQSILTVEGENGGIDYMFLDTIEAWVIPLEIQTNPENPENYTPIEFDDVYTGKVLYSILLELEPFSEDTATPEEFIYAQGATATGVDVKLIPRLPGEINHPAIDHTWPNPEIVNVETDIRRLGGLFRGIMPNKEEYNDYYGEEVPFTLEAEVIKGPEGWPPLVVLYLQ